MKSAFTKSYDYCGTAARTAQRDSFVLQPFLRGICEDLITLKYIKKHLKVESERNKIVQLFSWYLQYSSAKAQQEFFAKVKSPQLSLSLVDPDALISQFETELKGFWHAKGFNPNKIFPSVENMAIDAGLKDLYEFLYHATSKTVHFSPNILMRLGWFKSKEEPIIFSYRNFYKYYYQFNNYYALYLFVIFSTTFKNELQLSRGFMKEAKGIEKMLEDMNFYPELVTYEEMNMKRPSGFIAYLMKLARDKDFNKS